MQKAAFLVLIEADFLIASEGEKARSLVIFLRTFQTGLLMPVVLLDGYLNAPKFI